MDDSREKLITKFSKGEFIYREGDAQNFFYIINKGKVALKAFNNEIALITLNKGDFFGEESLNENQLAAYTVEVVEDAAVIKIPYPALIDMMKKSTDISLKILKKLSEKQLKSLENIINIQKDTRVLKKSESAAAENETENETTSEKLSPDIKAYLIIQRSNRIVQMTKAQTFIGRRDYTTGFAPDIDLTKEDEEKYISRKHALVAYVNGKFYLSEESGAVNGTFLNGKKLSTGVKYELNNEDEIILCHLNIMFKC